MGFCTGFPLVGISSATLPTHHLADERLRLWDAERERDDAVHRGETEDREHTAQRVVRRAGELRDRIADRAGDEARPPEPDHRGTADTGWSDARADRAA